MGWLHDGQVNRSLKHYSTVDREINKKSLEMKDITPA